MEWKGRRGSRNIEDRRGMSMGKAGGIGGLGAVVLLLIGLGLWIVNFLYDRLFLGRKVRFENPEDLARPEDEPEGGDPHRTL
jgi:predicted metalloprotease